MAGVIEDAPEELESKIHSHLRAQWVRGEWFHRSPEVEVILEKMCPGYNDESIED